MCPAQCLADELIVLRIPVLNQRTLHRLLMRRFRHVNRIHRPRVKTGIVHTGGKCGRRRIEVLCLLRDKSHIADVLGKLHRIQVTPRMGRHKIRKCVLLLPRLFVARIEAADKFLIYFVARFSHIGKHTVRNVLRRNAELTADVILYQLGKERLVFIGQDIVKTDARADEDFLHARNVF